MPQSWWIFHMKPIVVCPTGASANGPNEGENTGVDSIDQSLLVHWPQEGTGQYLKMMKTTFSGQWCSEQRLKKDDIGRPRLNLRNVSNREQPVSDYDSRMQRETVCNPTANGSAHTGKEKRWLLQFAHNLLCRVIRSQQIPTLKAWKKHNREKYLFQIKCPCEHLPTRVALYHINSYKLKYISQTEAISDCSTTNSIMKCSLALYITLCCKIYFNHHKAKHMFSVYAKCNEMEQAV